ncbi:NADH-quinone oxidoreductase subunit L [Candidatus Bathyarchaeota archaeon A05DMB-2]|nr:NADH-quinone oxidoreductase subunit L [Candidatus Bathyarchaeota archaeon A05DMB-2]
MLADVTSWLVWIFPLVSSVFVPLIARAGEKARNAFVIGVTAVTASLALTLIPAASSGEGGAINLVAPWISQAITAGVYIDPLSVLFTCLVGFFGLIIAIYSLGYMKHEENLTRYYFYLLLFIGSMIGLVISDNFLQLFIFWEMVGLCSYSLISFWNNRPESVKAGNKVFIMTRIGDASLLAAVGILYASLNTFSFHGTITAILNGTLPSSTLTVVAFLVLGGAIAKSAQLPLHTWLYSAMEAPTSISALLHAATMVKAGVYLIARFILIAAPMIAVLEGSWLPTVAWIGVLTAFLGATMALYTPDIKGVLAYSTVSQLGFMMAALGTSLAASESLGWFASLFHTMSHAFFEGLGFLLAGGIIHALGTRDMRLMGGLRKAMPVTYALAIIMILTTSGLPPFAAFFSKGLIITSITEEGSLLQVILIYATTAITFAYSLRFVKLIFLGKESEHLQKLHPHEAPKIMLAPAFVLAVACLIWGFLEPWLGSYMGVAEVPSLLSSFVGLETAIFAVILIPAGLLIYAAYWKNYSIMNSLRSASNPLAKLLSHGYFFDDFYEKVVAKGVMLFSRGVKFFEVVFLEIFPMVFANMVIRFAGGVHKYFEAAADQLLTVIAGRTVDSAAKVKTLDSLADRFLDIIARHTLRSASRAEGSSSSLQHYLAAALLGFIVLVILLIISVGV